MEGKKKGQRPKLKTRPGSTTISYGRGKGGGVRKRLLRFHTYYQTTLDGGPRISRLPLPLFNAQPNQTNFAFRNDRDVLLERNRKERNSSRFPATECREGLVGLSSSGPPAATARSSKGQTKGQLNSDIHQRQGRRAKLVKRKKLGGLVDKAFQPVAPAGISASGIGRRGGRQRRSCHRKPASYPPQIRDGGLEFPAAACWRGKAGGLPGAAILPACGTSSSWRASRRRFRQRCGR